MAKSKCIGKVLATVGEYFDNHTQQKKKRYVNCGAAFEDENGRISIKLDVIPVSKDWSNWLSIYPLDDNQGGPPQNQSRPPARRTERTTAPRPTQTQEEHHDDGLDDDDIPF